jgi:endonuclease/exonuclease/phosphatase family metal-dependent hydrolase
MSETSNAALLQLAGQPHVGDNNPLQDFDRVAAMHPDSAVPLKESSDGISVFSWNVLSPTWHGDTDGGRARLTRIKDWLRRANNDVVMLQEVDFDVFEDDLLPYMASIGYEGAPQHVPKREGQPCGVCVFWKSNQFRGVDSKTFSRALVVHLRSHQGNEFCAISVHLESAQAASLRRAQQLNRPLAWAASRQVPIVLAGDFNTGADSMLFHVLRSERWHGHRLAAAYEHPDAKTCSAAQVGSYGGNGSRYCIDHLLYSSDAFQLSSVYDSAVMHGALPNDQVPSDHIPIGARLLPRALLAPPPLPTVDPSRQAEIAAQWRQLCATKPPHVKQLPTKDEKAAFTEFKASVARWKSTMTKAERQLIN